MSEKSKREQQQKWLRTSHSCTTSWSLIVTQKSQSGQTLTFEPSALVQLKMCGASQHKPNRSKSTSPTFDRGGVFVKACPMLIARTRMQQLHQSQQLQQPEGWHFVPDTILPGYQWAPQWVPVRTPTVHRGPISGKAVGGPITVQHSNTEFNTAVTRRRNTANTVAEQCRSRARTLAARALMTTVCCVMTGQRNEETH